VRHSAIGSRTDLPVCHSALQAKMTVRQVRPTSDPSMPSHSPNRNSVPRISIHFNLVVHWLQHHLILSFHRM